MRHTKKILSLLLAVLMLTTTLFATGCDINAILNGLTGTTPESTTPEATTPENTTPEVTTSENTTPGTDTPVTPPSVFDGIEFSDPATVIPAAYALADGEVLEGPYTLKGKIISSDGYKAQYGDISVTIVVEGYEDFPLYCYQIKNDADKIDVGDTIAVQGKLKNYKGLIEFERPVMLAYEKGEVTPPDDNTSDYDAIKTDDPAVVIPMAYALATGATLDGTYTLKGQIIESDGLNAQYGDISVTFVV